MKKINSLIMVFVLLVSLTQGVFAGELSKKTQDDIHKQNLEYLKELQEKAEEDDGSVDQVSNEFNSYINNIMEENNADSNNSKLRKQYKEKYVYDFMTYAINNHIITGINLSDIDKVKKINEGSKPISKSTVDIAKLSSYGVDREIISRQTSGVMLDPNPIYNMRAQFLIACLLMEGVGLDYTAMFLRNSLQDNPPDKSFQYNSSLSNEIKTYKAYKDVMDDFKDELDDFSGNYYSKNGSMRLTKTSSSTDMYLAIHKCSYLIAAEKINGEWKIYQRIYDRYNFEYWNYGGSVPHNVVVIINNYATLAEDMGAIQPYNITIFTRDTHN